MDNSSAEERRLRYIKANEILDRDIAHLERTVSMFADVMAAKLKRKAREGFYGWADPENRAEVERRLRDHVDRLLDGGDRQQAVDVANLAMMLWYFDWQNEVDGIGL